MNKKRLYLIPALVILLLSTFTLSACNHPQTPEEKANWVVEKITNEIDLQAEQIVKLKDIKNEVLRHVKEHKAKKMEVMDNLIAEIKKPSMDQNFFMALIDQHKANLDQVAPSLIEKVVIFHESLTEQQKLKVVDILEKFKKHHHNHAS